MKSKSNRHSLSLKRSFFFRLFIIFMFILLLTLSSIILIWNNNIRETASRLSSSNIRDVFNIANSNFTSDLEGLYSSVNTISNNEITINYLKNPNAENAEKLRTYLDNCYSMNPDDIQGIAVMTEEGYVTGGYAYFTHNYKNLDWYHYLLTTDGACILFNHSDAEGRFIKIAIGKALIINGRTQGLLVCELDNSAILELFSIGTINNSLRTVILDENENVLFSNNREYAGEYIEDIVLASEYQQYNNILRTVTLNNQNYLMISQKINSTPGWINITYLPADYLYQDYKESLAFTLKYAFIIIVVSVILSFAIFLVWSKKLNKLCTYIEHIDINKPVTTDYHSILSKGDEIDSIYTKVNAMVNVMIVQLNTISQLEKKKHNYEIQVLRSQINPHLIYNTLNAIQTLAKIQKNTRIDNIAGSLSNLLRYSTTDIGKPVTLSSEIRYVQAYLEIMQNKFLNDIELVYTIEEDLMECRILKMLLQPIVENSIKHGFTDMPGNCIMIKAYRNNNNILIKIIDNGKGIPENKLEILLKDYPEQEEHLGLKNVDRRIKLAYGEQYGLNIFSVPLVQTTVLINIPYILEED